MPKIDLNKVPRRQASIYPEPYASQMAGRSWRPLAEAAGLTQFGVNIVHLEPGAPASLRHWHLREDEFAMVLTGELVLVEDDGETVMRSGDCAAWKAGEANAHHFVNRSDTPASFLVVGTSHPDEVATYGDVDMMIHMQGGEPRFTYHDGSTWAGPRDLPTKGDQK
ncbi:cupin domain-containing protein [Aquicoccus porphyridii]|uniref:Cupin domain-containing protein n=1 Tax=Aquicoccus porphyridii TaxID=1852029 RepID=A0A5A9YYY3_9RHOB|nr:cupin domain-containing protein [Aquicoccus porphyridii]KAA0910069.1 cupin domain-containing protein [Aquicoccus porphyridii]RAI53483.1 transcriptional regulator [Rhodobacteraceae bacterium AsT-22]